MSSGASAQARDDSGSRNPIGEVPGVRNKCRRRVRQRAVPHCCSSTNRNSGTTQPRAVPRVASMRSISAARAASSAIAGSSGSRSSGRLPSGSCASPISSTSGSS